MSPALKRILKLVMRYHLKIFLLVPVHNIELKTGKGGQLVRSAGGSAQLMAKEGEHAPSDCHLAKLE